MGEKVIKLSGPTSESLKCHLLPCRIDHDQATVKAEEYFWPTIRNLESGGDNDLGRIDKDIKDSLNAQKSAGKNPILTASFRGRPLQGRKVEIPAGYKGHVIIDKPKQSKRIDEFTYWNWDELPRDTDVVVKALQWIKIAEAIHDD